MNVEHASVQRALEQALQEMLASLTAQDAHNEELRAEHHDSAMLSLRRAAVLWRKLGGFKTDVKAKA